MNRNPFGRPKEFRGGRVRVSGCSPGCLLWSIALSVGLTILLMCAADATWQMTHELTHAGHERVIETRAGAGFIIVEKQGEAAPVAQDLDPRAAT